MRVKFPEAHFNTSSVKENRVGFARYSVHSSGTTVFLIFACKVNRDVLPPGISGCCIGSLPLSYYIKCKVLVNEIRSDKLE